MSTRSPGSDLPVRTIDRVLASMSLGLLALSVLSFFAILIGSASHADFSTGLTVLIMTFVRRARANRSQ